MCRSEPQMPASVILIMTPPGSGVGTSSSSITKGLAYSFITAARPVVIVPLRSFSYPVDSVDAASDARCRGLRLEVGHTRQHLLREQAHRLQPRFRVVGVVEDEEQERAEAAEVGVH